MQRCLVRARLQCGDESLGFTDVHGDEGYTQALLALGRGHRSWSTRSTTAQKSIDVLAMGSTVELVCD
jgi:hypothetical protein